MEGCAQQLLCRMALYTQGALMFPIQMVPQDGLGAMWSHRLIDPESLFPKKHIPLSFCAAVVQRARLVGILRSGYATGQGLSKLMSDMLCLYSSRY